METAILVALVSLSGVLLSALISWVVSKQRVDAEIRKVRYELQRSYAERLHQTRLQAYPSVYASLESFAKTLQRQQVGFAELQSFYQSLDRWHTFNGHMLGAETNGRFYVFLRRLGQVCSKSEAAFAARLADPAKRKELIRQTWSVELGLKNDLGIFGVEYFDPSKKFRSYQEVHEEEAPPTGA